MKRKDFESFIRDKGFFLTRTKRHLTFAHNELSYKVVIPNSKEINKMICRRLLKEIDEAFQEKKNQDARASTN